ncbi:VOC family protein [Paenibacillus mesophilus]|uniref:VOC family protein n=1 Tax=Paenibacillus mesophilus TaxID=2582849 RepID=UPI00110EA706|nr:VOC family protein [Paenibacillus mesophilus]TMV51608.1 VOC family protein [Paenibacillus mesophilus]
MNNRPITHIAAVFLPVKELKSSAAWWSGLLDLPIRDKGWDAIYGLPVAGTGILLDPNQYGFPHLVMYDTGNIDEAYRFAKEENYDIFYDLQRFPGVAFFNVFDAGKGNGIMICQGDNKLDKTAESLSGECPIRPEISRVFAHSGDVDATIAWYVNMLGLSLERITRNENGCELRPADGAKLQVLDHRRNAIGPVRFDKLNADIISHPLFELTTGDIAAARKWVAVNGGLIVEPMGDESESGSSFHFRDPDGNTIRVTEQR